MREAARMLPTSLLLLLLVCASCSAGTSSAAAKPAPESATNVHPLTVADLDGKPVDLARYRGTVLLVVNVASECGYTPQYEGLEALEKELAPKGFQVLGFPCNEFGGQEPGDAGAIRTFCTEKYSVTFPLFAKVQVKAGEGQAPLFGRLGTATGKLPTWNFCKYVVGKDGEVRAFFASKVKPDDAELRAEIEKALAEKS
jgi:glutathione peroxidase